MRAFALDEFGQPGSIRDLPDPKPAEGEVLVRVAAASLNPFDNFVLQGYLKDRMEHRFGASNITLLPTIQRGVKLCSIAAFFEAADGLGSAVLALIGEAGLLNFPFPAGAAGGTKTRGDHAKHRKAALLDKPAVASGQF